MSGVNKCIILGRLGQDPELRYMADGTAVCRLSVATSETWKDKATGDKQEKTEWHHITLWRRLAEIAGEYLRKGSQVFVEGKIQTRSYEKDGQKHYSTEIVAASMQLLDKRDSGTASKEFYGDPPPARSEPGVDDDPDIPF